MYQLVIRILASFIRDKEKRKNFRRKLLNSVNNKCFKEYHFKKNLCKKDVALVGLWGNVNYGSVLTNFAAYHFIKDLGKSVLLIERPKKSLEEPYVGNIFRKIPYPSEDVSCQYDTIEDMKELNDVSDTFIVNSDILYGEYSVRVFSQFMLLDYIHNDKNKYTYAASFGFDTFTGNEMLRQKIETSLSFFKKFTVREKSGIHVSKKYFNVDAEWVLDPLFLCDINHFKDFAQRGKSLVSKGLCCYILDTAEHDGLKVVEDVSQTLNLKNYVISDYQRYDNRKKDVTIEDWLATYLDSEFIITDSFHGTCMAIILKKPFITIANVRRGFTRFESILELAGLRDRLILNFDEYKAKKEMLLKKPINWEEVSLNMQEKIKRSKEIFREMIE